jgi:hypothetical protein
VSHKPPRAAQGDPDRRKAGPGSAGPWNEGSRLPQIPTGTFDAAALLASVTESLRPVLDRELEAMALSLSAAATAPGSGDLAADLRTELVRQLVPQFTEAVRAAVIDGIRTRQIHLAQLAVIDRAAFQGHKLTALQQRIDHELVRTGLLRVTDTKDLSFFNLLDSEAVADHGDAAPVYSVVAPAYVDQESGRTVERGWLSVSYDQPADTGPAQEPPSQGRRDHSRARSAAPPEQTTVLPTAAPGGRPQKKKHRKGSPPTPLRSSGAVPAELPSVHTAPAAPPPGFRPTVQNSAVQSARAKFGSKENR